MGNDDVRRQNIFYYDNYYIYKAPCTARVLLAREIFLNIFLRETLRPKRHSNTNGFYNNNVVIIIARATRAETAATAAGCACVVLSCGNNLSSNVNFQKSSAIYFSPNGGREGWWGVRRHAGCGNGGTVAHSSSRFM